MRVGALASNRRRGAAYDPSSLFPSAEGAWYDPSDLSTMWKDTAGTVPVTADGDLVARIDDKSGNGHHLTQATEALRPGYNTAGGLHWLSFDGNKYMMGTLPVAQLGGNLDKTAFAAVRAGTNDNVIFDYGTASTNLANFGLRRGTNKRATFQWAAQLESTSAATANDEVWTGIKDNNLLSFRTDQSLDGGPTDMGAANIVANTLMVGQLLGTGNVFIGRLYGLIIVEGLPIPADTISWLAEKQGRTI